MSLFEDPLYRWRETFFVLFQIENRPDEQRSKQLLKQLAQHYTVEEPRVDEHGRVESFTLLAPDDFAAMDVTFVAGDDVTAQVEELIDEMVLNKEEASAIDRIRPCNARFEIYHFEQLAVDDDDDEHLDPGTLFLVMDVLSSSCQGLGIDPQSGTVVDG